MKQHSKRFLARVAQAKQRIKEITPQALKAMMDRHDTFYLIDVREAHELGSGRIPGAIHLSKGVIERDIEQQISDPDTSIVVYCSGGFRCALVAESLRQMGYTHVQSLDTGSQGWLNAGYDLVESYS